jgi:hypothetical protein
VTISASYTTPRGTIKYGFGNGAPRGVQVNMEVRRDQFTVNTEPRVCRYVYRDGSTDISRT